MLDDLIELPEGWSLVTFGEVCRIQGGYAFQSKDYEESGLPLIRISNLVDGCVDINEKTVFLPEHYLDKFPEYHLYDGDVLIAMSGATTGKMARYSLKGDALLNQRVGRFNINLPEAIDSIYLEKLVSNFTERVLQEAYGGAQPNISPKEIENFEIPLPPLNEQKRIVAKIEELRSHTQAARNAIAHIPKLLEQFRQSVLAAAFRGDLTAEWRSENPDVEPAEILLERIRKESEKTSKKPAKRPDIIEPNFLDIPESWEIILSNDIFSFVTSGSRGWAQYYSDTGAIFVRVGNLNRDTISLDFKDIQLVNPPEGTEGIRTKIQPGDILVSITADVGMIGLVPEDISEAYINQHVSLARPLKNLYHDYFAWYLASFHDGYKQFQLLQRGATKAGLGLDDIRSIWIPLPPLNEQKRIVSHIEESLIAIDRIEQQYQFIKTELDRLDRSILAKAFKGELVPQDPTDEPAIVLLERIRNDRASQVKPAKTKRKKA